MQLEDIKRFDSEVFAENDSKSYTEFKEKFKPKRTTDDCYTPDNIYEIVADYVANEYGKDKDNFVRPFYPGGDYQNYDYPTNCTVVDNPPFSILASIVDWYNEHKIDYFLFAPELTILGYARKANCIITDCQMVYENGAKINTGFVTNMGEYKVKICSELNKRLNEANKENRKSKNKQPKYEYHDNALTIARLKRLACARGNFAIKKESCHFVRRLDSQKESGTVIYGGGLLISDKCAAELKATELKAAERKAAERKAAELKAEDTATVWEISEREREIINTLT